MQENTTYEQLPAKPDGFHTGTLREKYPDVVGPLPWRESLASAPTKTVSLPQYEAHTVYTASLRLTLGRTVYWLRAIFAFLFGIFLDIRFPWRHDTPERLAERRYQIIQDLGGSFLKIGQQVGIRIDILPYEDRKSTRLNSSH